MTYDFQAALMDFATPRPGWMGHFTTTQAPDALPNGTRIVKCDQDSDRDLTPMGTKGTVLGSMFMPEKGICYFIEWDDKPKCAVAVINWKIKPDFEGA